MSILLEKNFNPAAFYLKHEITCFSLAGAEKYSNSYFHFISRKIPLNEENHYVYIGILTLALFSPFIGNTGHIIVLDH